MTDTEKTDAFTAMMLLETALDGMNPELGTKEQMIVAAHSFLQVATLGMHSSPDAADFVASMKAKTTIADAMRRDN